MGTGAIFQKPRSTHSTAPVSRYAPTVTTSLAPSPYAVGRSRHLDRASTSTVSRADRPLASWPMTPSGITGGVARVAHAPSRSAISEAVLASSGGFGVAVGAGETAEGDATGDAPVDGAGGTAEMTGAVEAVADAIGTGALHATATRVSATMRRTGAMLDVVGGPRVRVRATGVRVTSADRCQRPVS